MPLTRSFNTLVQRHVMVDPVFGAALLWEGIDTMLSGYVETGKAILRNYIKATIGFEKLGKATGTQPKSLIRMFGPRGNPLARNLFSVIGYLQRQAGLQLHMTTGSHYANRKRAGAMNKFGNEVVENMTRACEHAKGEMGRVRVRSYVYARYSESAK
jgi:hypothetical protein